MSHRYWRLPSEGYIFWIIVICIVIVIALVLLLQSHQEQAKIKGLTDKQKETLENIDAQILSMLIQHGGSLKQNEITSNLDLPQDIITTTLLDLEKQDMITREWLADEFTYRISNK